MSKFVGAFSSVEYIAIHNSRNSIDENCFSIFCRLRWHSSSIVDNFNWQWLGVVNLTGAFCKRFIWCDISFVRSFYSCQLGRNRIGCKKVQVVLSCFHLERTGFENLFSEIIEIFHQIDSRLTSGRFHSIDKRIFASSTTEAHRIKCVQSSQTIDTFNCSAIVFLSIV